MKKLLLILWILFAAFLQDQVAQNAPVSVAGNVSSTGTSLVLPITVTDFINIGSCNLEMYYDPSIATVTSVTAAPPLSSGFSGLDYYIPVPGTVRFGWYVVPGLTIPDNSVAFLIEFSKVANGVSPVTWSSDDMSCIYTDGSYNTLNDAPASSYYIAGSVEFQDYAPTTYFDPVVACPGSVLSVPVKVNNFNTIGAVSLTLNYDPSVLSFVSGVNTSGYPGLIINSPSVGVIIIGGFSSSAMGVTYPDNQTLCTLNFDYLGGATGLNWIDDGGSCEYAGPLGTPTLNDSPQSTYYLNGMVSPGLTTDWLGSMSTSWENPGNWSCGVPGITSTANVNNGMPNYPLISSDVVIAGLNIASLANLIVGPTGTLTVSGSLVNNAGVGGILIQSDATGTGSLITNSVVNATVQRYINSPWIDCCHGWHFLSSPVNAQPVQPEFVTSPPNDAIDFYSWGEPANEWINSQTSSGWASGFEPEFIVGKGYLSAYQVAGTRTFAGTLNVTDVPVSSLTNNGSTANHGWNLLGNPYPSALKWNDGNWALNNVASIAKIWQESAAAYVDIFSDDIIPAMNGFMVQVVGSPAGSLMIPATARVHSALPWYKSTDERIVLTVRDIENSTAQQSIIRINDQATEGFDAAFDARFLPGYAPLFYSTQNGESLSTNTLPDLSDNRAVEMGFVKNLSSSFSIELTASTISSVGTIFLTDKLTGSVTDLTTDPVYSFTASEGEDANRFKLTFKGAYSVPESLSASGFTVYATGGVIHVTSESANGKVMVNDMAGRMIGSDEVSAGSPLRIDMQGHPGVYIVRVIAASGAGAQKVIVR